jgi:sec-independent protein translocase protein TatA
MPGIGPMEMVIVLVIALLILGPKRLPDAGRSLGAGMREFKDSLMPRHHDEPVAEVAPAPPVAAAATAPTVPTAPTAPTAPREG